MFTGVNIMEKRKMNKNAEEVSLLGFGCMRFPLDSEGKIDEGEAGKLLDTAIAGGVNYIDTAYPYHDGASEDFVGRHLEKYDRNSYYLATKLPVWKIEKTEDVRTIFEEQLKNLRTDHVDFYLLHALDKEKWENVLKFGMMEECLKLKEEGKIRNLGFSFHDELDVFKEIINYRDWDFVQIQLNYVDNNIQQGIEGYDIAFEKGIPVVIMEPVKGGALAKLPPAMENIFRELRPEASVASWAFRYVGSMEGIKVILSGMTTMEQVEDNLKTFSDFEPLSRQEEAAVERVTSEYRSRQENRCTTCGYCMPCPFGIKIPKNFKIWNTASIYEDHEKGRLEYMEMEEGERAAACRHCGACEPKCPQMIEIIRDLEKVAETFSAE